MIDSAQHQVLYALFCFSRDTRHISATTLADAVGLTATRTAAILVTLERAGLVDASRARLTLIGLATAVRLGPAGFGPLRAARPAKDEKRSPVATPLAAAPHLADPPVQEPTVERCPNWAATPELRAN